MNCKSLIVGVVVIYGLYSCICTTQCTYTQIYPNTHLLMHIYIHIHIIYIHIHIHTQVHASLYFRKLTAKIYGTCTHMHTQSQQTHSCELTVWLVDK